MPLLETTLAPAAIPAQLTKQLRLSKFLIAFAIDSVSATSPTI